MTRLETAEQLEERTGVRKERWYALARENLCPSVKLGRQVRFVPDQVDAWLRSGGSSLPGGWRKEAPTK